MNISHNIPRLVGNPISGNFASTRRVVSWGNCWTDRTGSGSESLGKGSVSRVLVNGDMVGLMLHRLAYCIRCYRIMSQEFDVLSQFGNEGLDGFYFFLGLFCLGKKGLVIICEFRHCCLQGPYLCNAIRTKPGETFHATIYGGLEPPVILQCI